MDADTERARHLAVVEIPMKVVSSRNVSAAGDRDLRMYVVRTVVCKNGMAGPRVEPVLTCRCFFTFLCQQINLKLNLLGLM